MCKAEEKKAMGGDTDDLISTSWRIQTGLRPASSKLHHQDETSRPILRVNDLDMNSCEPSLQHKMKRHGKHVAGASPECRRER